MDSPPWGKAKRAAGAALPPHGSYDVPLYFHA